MKPVACDNPVDQFRSDETAWLVERDRAEVRIAAFCRRVQQRWASRLVTGSLMEPGLDD